MDVKYRRNTTYGSVNVEVEAYNTQTEGEDLLSDCIDKSGVFAGQAGTSIRLDGMFGRCEALFITGGRRSIIESLRLQGTSPEIEPKAGSELWAWFFRKKQTFGKNQTLVAICANKCRVNPGGWDVEHRLDLRFSLGSPYYTRHGAMSPSRLADLCERIFDL